MMVVVAYDIASGDREGRKRLREIARKCANWGVAVQNSVYECEINAEQYRKLRGELTALILPERDCVCFYLLGNHYHSRIGRIGKERVRWDRETFVI